MTIGIELAPHRRVFASFMMYAIAMGSIFPRLPDIKAAMGVEEGALGLALIGAPLGTLLALTFATPLIERVGYRRGLLGSIPLIAVAYALAVQTSSPVLFFLWLIPAGFLIGCTEIIINVEADRTEALLGKRIMNRAHAFWSIGFFTAGLLGAVMAHLGVSPQWHLGLIVPLSILVVALCLGRFTPAPLRGSNATAAAPRFALPTTPILLLVAVTFSAMLMEGAGLDWSAIYMVDLFNSGPFMAGFAVATLAFTQAVCRWFADGVIEKHSPRLVGRSLLICLAIGVLLLFFPIAPGLALLGFALVGIGTSAIFPMAMSAAAQRTDRSAAINVAALAQISFVAFLLGPPLLGFAAEHLGIQWVYGFGLPLIILSLLTVKALGDKPQTTSTTALSPIESTDSDGK